MLQPIRIYVADNVDDVLVGILPKLNQIVPLLGLIVLDGNPSIVISEIGIIGKNQRAFLVLKVNDSVGIVRRRIDKMSHDLFNRSVLAVFAIVEYTRRYG